MSERRSPSRRGILKGAVAGAVVAGLGATAEAAPADAELLAMGRELEALQAQERVADETSDRLYDEATRACPAPSAALLAYSWQGEPLFLSSGEGYRLNGEPYGALLQRVQFWRDQGVSGDRYPEAPLIADLKRWEDGRRAACDANGCTAAMKELDRLALIGHALCVNIATTPATTPAGLRVKLQALAHCHRGEPGDGAEWISEVIKNNPVCGRGFTTDERLVFSVVRDVGAVLTTGTTS
ncbi:hypothetical protein ABLE93_14770 [Xanthobacter sp. KR7-65]|uniref:hypothetical protein n=1 Tax=Xanthobacter sp. KR7-65 TaxID=3156612 RepID=UPI0032B47D4D